MPLIAAIVVRAFVHFFLLVNRFFLSHYLATAMLPSVGMTELVVIAVLAVILFGKRLPEVARNVGRSYGELRKGLSEMQSSINSEIDATSRSANENEVAATNIDDFDEPTAPKLEPPPTDSADTVDTANE